MARPRRVLFGRRFEAQKFSLTRGCRFFVMKIKRLEIVGFKSFVDKVSLDFQQGITGVIGPNGCGKSNVVDAIRWAMGEQNVRHLRGRAMEDVIFGGSETRKPHGMAQVSIVFDNSAKLCPEAYRDFSEVMVSRRLYRNGDSEYQINKTPCRLLDITELFMDTGVGPRAYSIIEQGKVGMMVSAKPEERRVLIEEVAGVTKFKSRKKSAERKMDATRQNLVRLGDIITEVRRQIGSLKRQAQRAEKFRDLRTEYKRIELGLTGNRFQGLHKNIGIVTAEKQERADILARLDARLEEGELQLEERQLQMAAAEAEHASAQERVYHLGSEVQRVENELTLLARQAEQSARQEQELVADIASSTRQLTELQQEYAGLQHQDKDADGDLAQLRQQVGELETALQQQQARETQLSSEYENCRKELMTLFAQAGRLSNRCDEIDRRLDAEAKRREQIVSDSVAIREQQNDFKSRREELLGKLEGIRSQQEDTRDRREELTVRLAEQKSLLAGQEAQQGDLQQKLNLLQSRRDSLQELQRNFEGYEDGTRVVLKAKTGSRLIFADTLRVPAELEVAVEVALGKRLQAIPVTGGESVFSLLQVLQEEKSRAALIISATTTADFAFSQGVPLAQLVTPVGGHDALVQRLLAGIYLVDTVVDFLTADLPPGLLLVDRSGNCLDWQGVLVAGNAEAGAGGLLRRQRQLDELEQEIVEVEKRCQSGAARLEALKEDLLQSEEALLVTSSEAHRLELDALELGKDRQSLQADEERLNKRLELIVYDLEQIDESREHLLREKDTILSGREQTDEQQRQLEQRSLELQSAQQDHRESLEQTREELTRQKVALAALVQQRQSLQDTVKRIGRQSQEIEARIAQLQLKKDAGVLERKQWGDRELRLRAELDVLLDRRGEQQKENDALRERYEEQRQALEEFRDQLRRVRGEAEDLRKTVSALQLRLHELQVDAENVRQNVLERYRVDLVEHRVPEATEDELERQQLQLQRLQQKIDALGEVNLMAIEEYQEQEKRYDFLSQQRDDLNQSLDALQKAISQINRTTRRRFKETFEKVNETFQQVFPRLFRGGKAELRLTDDSDLLETGVEIIVQPPGKRLQNVNLLSGGEKALTAVALIFSLFLIKPTPFCILDEVDAPLDDANIDRFAEMVTEMTAQSQFIIITHSKRTMSVLDTMYGVTMQEPGVSKLVSVRMEGGDPEVDSRPALSA